MFREFSHYQRHASPSRLLRLRLTPLKAYPLRRGSTHNAHRRLTLPNLGEKWAE